METNGSRCYHCDGRDLSCKIYLELVRDNLQRDKCYSRRTIERDLETMRLGFPDDRRTTYDIKRIVKEANQVVL